MRAALDRIRVWAKAIRRDGVALYLAARDPRVPWPVKALAALIAAYALSPIDLIPDFIPVLGLLDELVLLPLAILGLVRLIGPALMAEHRAAASAIVEQPHSKLAAAIVVCIWLLAAGAALRVAWRWVAA
jgi:uncharacterized membrane protein YkvA (DUF1232 family)